MSSRTQIEPVAAPLAGPATAAPGDALKHVAIIMDGNRPLGALARHAAGVRPSARRRGGAPHGRRLPRARHPLPDPVRLLVGELAPPGERGQRADEPAALLSAARDRRARAQRRAPALSRRARADGRRHRRDDGRGRAAHPAQRRADAHHRAQLRQPRARSPAPRASSPSAPSPASSTARRSTRRCSAAPSTRWACPTRTC